MFFALTAVNQKAGRHTDHSEKFIEVVLHRRAGEKYSSRALERGQGHGRPGLGVLGWMLVGVSDTRAR